MPDPDIVPHLSYFLPSRAGYTHLCNQPRETPNREAMSVMVSPEPFRAPVTASQTALKSTFRPGRPSHARRLYRRPPVRRGKHLIYLHLALFRKARIVKTGKECLEPDW